MRTTSVPWDQDIDRLHWVVEKQFHAATTVSALSGDGHSQRAAPGYLLVAKFLQRIGDHAERIASAYPLFAEGKTLDPKLAKDLEETAASAVVILDRAFNALISRDIGAANEAIDAGTGHQRLIDAPFHRVAVRKGEELLGFGTVVDSLSRSARYSADIAEQAINVACISPTDSG